MDPQRKTKIKKDKKKTSTFRKFCFCPVAGTKREKVFIIYCFVTHFLLGPLRNICPSQTSFSSRRKAEVVSKAAHNAKLTSSHCCRFTYKNCFPMIKPLRSKRFKWERSKRIMKNESKDNVILEVQRSTFLSDYPRRKNPPKHFQWHRSPSRAPRATSKRPKTKYKSYILYCIRVRRKRVQHEISQPNIGRRDQTNRIS